MKKKLRNFIKEILLFLLIITIFANGISLYKSTDLNKEPLQLTAITLLNGEEYKLEANKPILIHIWATWCPTCKLEASNIQTISQYYNVLTIAVKSGSDTEIKNWMQKNEYTFNVVNDSNATLASKFNIEVFPTTFIYNKDKHMAFSEVGYSSTWGLFLRMWWTSL